MDRTKWFLREKNCYNKLKNLEVIIYFLGVKIISSIKNIKIYREKIFFSCIHTLYNKFHKGKKDD